VIVPLDGREFPLRSWAADAPADATQAEIRLVQPRGKGGLLVEYISLAQADTIGVPLTFLAEAPGELTVSNVRVAYDLPEPPQPVGRGVPRGRALGFTMLSGAPPAATPGFAAVRRSPLLDSRVDLVAGVGERFLEILSGLPSPVTTVAELAALDPAVVIARIPRERRLELKAAAEMILDIDIAEVPFTTLAGEPLDALLALAPAELARRAGQSTDQAEQFQRKLRALRRLVKNDAFRRMRLSDLI
jgi:hypothetical protein